MFIGFPVITVEGVKWAVVIVTWHCLTGQYELRLRRGWETKFITIGRADYEPLFSPENNPQQPFRLDEEES